MNFFKKSNPALHPLPQAAPHLWVTPTLAACLLGLLIGSCQLPDGTNVFGDPAPTDTTDDPSTVGNGTGLTIRFGTKTWEFNSSADYTFDANAVEFTTNGTTTLVSLLAKDQTDDDNDGTNGFGAATLTDTQWDATNNWMELDATGLTNQTGDIESRVIDAGSAQDWTTLYWTPAQAYGIPLPDNGATETGYTSFNADMTDCLLLHHLESDGTDSCGSSLNGTVGGALVFAAGIDGSAGDFDGANDEIALVDDAAINTSGPYADRSISVWFRADTTAGKRVIFEEGDTTSGMNIYIDTGTLYMGGWNTSVAWAGNWVTSAVSTATWYHAVLVLSGGDGTPTAGRVTAYLNGSSLGTTTGAELDTHTGMVIGASDGTYYQDTTNGIGSYFDGLIDEFAMFDDALTAAEVQGMYLRAATNATISVLSCSTPAGDCTTDTYGGNYDQSTTDDPTALSPPMSVTIVAAEVTTERYFRYFATLDTLDTTNSPAIESIVVGPDHFPDDSPVVELNNGQTFLSLAPGQTYMDSTEGGSSAGSYTLQLSPDGSDWYYWDGANWVITVAGEAESTSISDAASNVSSFDEDASTTTFYFRVYLTSDGSQRVDLDTISLELFNR